MEAKMQQRKPGTRPYECVRRAWHSDRLQPIRGSLIQEIFRVVNEVHSSMTKKNKEWQDKLPAVVLRTEEILYSKANSQAEYMDLTTLWDRTNDAINTIIRRDGDTETGQFLHPCIEAALNLGCPATNATRSQRNCSSSNLRCYLTSNIVHNAAIQSDQAIGYSTHLRKECRTAVYPLYYGNFVHQEEKESYQIGFGARPGKFSKPLKMGQLDSEDVHSRRNEVKCDLSLWLGCQPATADVRDNKKQGLLLKGNLNGDELLGVQLKKRKADVFPHLVDEQQQQQQQQQQQHLCLKPRLSI